MTLTPIVSRDPATIREALVRRGMDESRASGAVLGLRPVAVLFDFLDGESRDALTGTAIRQGIDCVSGEGWALLSGSTSRLAGLVRNPQLTFPEPIARELGAYLSGLAEPVDVWRSAGGAVVLEGPVVVGILNVTPDSFSDGGRYVLANDAIAHANAMIDAGAGMLDVGAESTRPGRPEPVSEEEEWLRLEPVLEELTRQHPNVPLSVDTVKSGIAKRALEAGVWAVNDVSGLRFDPTIADVCAKQGAGLVLMHSRGSLAEMAGYEHATYDDVTVDVTRELLMAVERAESRGVGRESLVIDPGLGFAKTPEQNCELLKALPHLTSFGIPILVGPSRKRFLGTVTGKEVLDRDVATAAACVAAYLGGAKLFRVHAVEVVKEALDVASAVGSF